MSNEVVESVRSAEDVGRSQYTKFVEERIASSTKTVYDTVSKNSMAFFKSGQRKSHSKSQTKAASMKHDVQLFSQLYISCQSRDGAMDTFFEHENHAWPPALAENNNMRQGNKAALVGCLEQSSTPPVERPQPEVKIIDGAALVHTLDPKASNTTVKTFGDYSSKIFLPYILREVGASQRVDIVWDTYKSDSLKAYIRQTRGSGDILRVAANTAIPTNWKTFLRVDSNKMGLFDFLANGVESVVPPDNKIIVTTKGSSVTSVPPSDVSDLQPCTQ